MNRTSNRKQNIFESVTNRIKGTFEISSLNSEVRSRERQVKESFARIGELFFNENMDADLENYTDEFKQIKKLRKENTIIQSKISIIKGMVKCKSCEKWIQRDAKFCPNCATPVELKPILPLLDEDNQKICIGCKKSMDIEDGFCPFCGKENNAIPKTQDALEANMCVACGKELEDDELFCARCGTKRSDKVKVDVAHDDAVLEDEFDASNSDVEKELVDNNETEILEQIEVLDNIVQNDGDACPECGAETDSEADFCFDCGAKLN